MPLNKKKVTAIAVGGIAVSLVAAALWLVPATSRLMQTRRDPPPDAIPELPLAPLSVARTLLDKCGPDGPWVHCLDEVNRVVETYRHEDINDPMIKEYDGGIFLDFLAPGPAGPGIAVLSVARLADGPAIGIGFSVNYNRLRSLDELMRRWATPQLPKRPLHRDEIFDAGIAQRLDENPISQLFGVHWVISDGQRGRDGFGNSRMRFYCIDDDERMDDWRRADEDKRPLAPKYCSLDFKVIGNHPPKSMGEAWKALTELLLEHSFPTKTPATPQQP